MYIQHKKAAVRVGKNEQLISSCMSVCVALLLEMLCALKLFYLDYNLVCCGRFFLCPNDSNTHTHTRVAVLGIFEDLRYILMPTKGRRYNRM